MEETAKSKLCGQKEAGVFDKQMKVMMAGFQRGMNSMEQEAGDRTYRDKQVIVMNLDFLFI